MSKIAPPSSLSLPPLLPAQSTLFPAKGGEKVNISYHLLHFFALLKAWTDAYQSFLNQDAQQNRENYLEKSRQTSQSIFQGGFESLAIGAVGATIQTKGGVAALIGEAIARQGVGLDQNVRESYRTIYQAEAQISQQTFADTKEEKQKLEDLFLRKKEQIQQIQRGEAENFRLR